MLPSVGQIEYQHDQQIVVRCPGDRNRSSESSFRESNRVSVGNGNEIIDCMGGKMKLGGNPDKSRADGFQRDVKTLAGNDVE